MECVEGKPLQGPLRVKEALNWLCKSSVRLKKRMGKAFWERGPLAEFELLLVDFAGLEVDTSYRKVKPARSCSSIWR